MRLIDADKIVEQINEWLDQTGAIPLNTSYHFELLGCIEDCSTIDAVPVVRGEWEVAIGYDPNKKVQCQNCYKMAYEPTPHCPNCGAKMDTEGRNGNNS